MSSEEQTDSVNNPQKETDAYLQIESGLKEHTLNQPKRRIGEKTVKGVIIGRGENKAIIPISELEHLAELHLSYEAIADFYGVKPSTLRDNFKHLIERGRAKTKQRLMHAMLTNAIDKMNPTIQIFLAKNMLGMSSEPINNDEDSQVLPWLEGSDDS
tara:strand:+ start:753 stop:1223 length:471 start_codon:yes stop_codon:yes gene_type:complete